LRSPTSARILVVGAGIAGLGTARALARAGFAAEVVERQRTWQEAGAGIYLPGNAARALRALDLEHAVVDKAVVITSQRVCDHRGRQARGARFGHQVRVAGSAAIDPRDVRVGAACGDR